ncbi:ABC transporter permease [Cohnella fermenti]|uniref:Sugar ABC transporter permease n=1 Tax=Cohnella fermenti TaxID=2565925 RepID=A0A4S4C1T6_9BACL|nr:ABC transporter permease subunit [Cohnella fermenti]THF81621.1 sugar ABC transporter permease [Cohnella fermenti]
MDNANRRAGRWMRQVWEQKILYLFVLPALMATLVFSYGPMYGVIMAFQDYDILRGLGGSDFNGVANFNAFLSDPDFYRAVRNTAVLSTLNILVCFPLPIVFAILINEFGPARLKKLVQSITYLPHFISWVIVSGLLYRLLDQDTGAVNLLLHTLGVDKIGFFRDPQYFWGIFIVASIWKELGWSSILYLSAMTAINPELYEAALVDGASRFKRIWHITLPGILPTIVMLLILTIAAFFSGAGGFEPAYALRNPMVATHSDIIDIFAYFRGVRNGEYGYAAAIGLSQSIMAILFLFVSNKGLKKLTGYSLF